MPTIQVYVNEEVYARIMRHLEEHREDKSVYDNAEISATVIASRLLRWYAKNPDGPLRHSAIQP